MRRERKNAVNPLEELLIIMKQYFPKLTSWIENLTDTRHQSYIIYDFKICLLTQILAFCSSYKSMNKIDRDFNSDIVIDCKYVEQLSNVIRSEWQIENNLHWYLDTVFREDANKSYKNESQKNLNIIRKFCLGIIKQIKSLYNQIVNSVRQILSMCFENEIERIFNSLH